MAIQMVTGTEDAMATAKGKVAASRRGGSKAERAVRAEAAERKRKALQDAQVECFTLTTVLSELKAGTYEGYVDAAAFARRLLKLDGRQLASILAHFGLTVPSQKAGTPKQTPDQRKRLTLQSFFLRKGKTYRDVCDAWITATGVPEGFHAGTFTTYATTGKAYSVVELKDMCKERKMYYSGSAVKCAERLARFIANGHAACPDDLTKARAVATAKPRKATVTPEQLLAAYLEANPTATEAEGQAAVRNYLMLQSFQQKLKDQAKAAAKLPTVF